VISTKTLLGDGAMPTDRLNAGSRMHILDWLDSGSFVPSINEMLHGTGFFVPQSARRMPKGWNDPAEACLGKECEELIEDDLNSLLRRWWLVHVRGANVPNWDLACRSLVDGDQAGLVLVEAKAHEKEFKDGFMGKEEGNVDNHRQISAAIDEARRALSIHADGVNISAQHWHQFSNRVAFAWKLASEGIPTILIYLGFTGDQGMSKRSPPFRDHEHWKQTVLNNLQHVFPRELWARNIDCGRGRMRMMIRSLPCIRPSPEFNVDPA
jgi:hypothetical protein